MFVCLFFIHNVSKCNSKILHNQDNKKQINRNYNYPNAAIQSKPFYTNSLTIEEFELLCSPLITNNNNVWLRGEVPPTGLVNQFFGIYSYIPFAMMLNANIILGNMYSRTSYNLKWPIKHSEWKRIPFSSFFHWEYFHQYWKKRGIDTIEQLEYDYCFPSKESVVINRTQGFFPLSRGDLLLMIAQANLSLPVKPNTTIQLLANHGFVTLIDHWENKSLHLEIHNSLKPSPLINQYVFQLQSILPKQYFAIHLRLEEDLLSSQEILNFTEELHSAFYHIINSKCFQSLKSHFNSTLNHTVYDNPPPLYFASGIFKHYPFYPQKGKQGQPKDSKSDSLSSFFHKFKEYGFQYLVNRDLLWSKRKRQYHYDTKLLPRDNNNPYQTPSFVPEQYAYIDFLMSKKSYCFIDAHRGSSFSYFVERSKYLDQGIIHDISDIYSNLYSNTSRIFEHWGM